MPARFALRARFFLADLISHAGEPKQDHLCWLCEKCPAAVASTQNAHRRRIIIICTIFGQQSQKRAIKLLSVQKPAFGCPAVPVGIANGGCKFRVAGHFSPALPCPTVGGLEIYFSRFFVISGMADSSQKTAGTSPRRLEGGFFGRRPPEKMLQYRNDV